MDKKCKHKWVASRSHGHLVCEKCFAPATAEEFWEAFAAIESNARNMERTAVRWEGCYRDAEAKACPGEEKCEAMRCVTGRATATYSRLQGLRVKYSARCEMANQQAANIRTMQERIDELQAWKKEAEEIETQWDVLAVRKALGVGHGKWIRPWILPGIESLQAVNRSQAERIEELETKLSARYPYGAPVSRAYHARVVNDIYHQRRDVVSKNQALRKKIEELESEMAEERAVLRKQLELPPNGHILTAIVNLYRSIDALEKFAGVPDRPHIDGAGGYDGLPRAEQRRREDIHRLKRAIKTAKGAAATYERESLFNQERGDGFKAEVIRLQNDHALANKMLEARGERIDMLEERLKAQATKGEVVSRERYDEVMATMAKQDEMIAKQRAQINRARGELGGTK